MNNNNKNTHFGEKNAPIQKMYINIKYSIKIFMLLFIHAEHL